MNRMLIGDCHKQNLTVGEVKMIVVTGEKTEKDPDAQPHSH